VRNALLLIFRYLVRYDRQARVQLESVPIDDLAIVAEGDINRKLRIVSVTFNFKS